MSLNRHPHDTGHLPDAASGPPLPLAWESQPYTRVPDERRFIMKTGGRRPWATTSGFAALLFLALFATPSPTHATAAGAHRHRDGVCAGLHGAARGLCVAYCTALRCDVRARPGCAALHAVFVRVTGEASLPCEVACGDGVVNGPDEECDAAGGPCADGQPCNADCTCPPPLCGNGRLDAQEQCDPPGSTCAAGDVCSAACTCPGPNPECAGSVCGAFVPCNPGTACEDPVCASTAEGGGACIEGTIVCEDLADCTATADCPDGGPCVVDTCCGRPVCIPLIAACKLLPLGG